MADEMVSEDVIVNETNEAMDDISWDNIEETSPILQEEEESQDEEMEVIEEDSEEVDEESDDSDEVEDGEEVSKDTDSEEKEEEEESSSLSLDELDDDAKITVKVDGELQEVTIKEFKSGISGQKALARKWTEVDKVHKQNQEDIAAVNEYVNTFSEKMKGGSALDAMNYLGSFSGMGPHQIKQSLISALMPEIERMGLLSQSEIDLEYQKAENAFLKEKSERDSVMSEKKQAQENFQKLINDTKSEHQIEDSEWDSAISYLDKHLDAGEPITPELVVDYVKYDRASQQADTLLNVEGENLLNDDNLEVMTQIILDNPSFTQEDLEEVVREGLAIAKKDAIEKEAARRSQKAEAKKKQTKQVETDFDVHRNEYDEEIESLYDL